LKLQEEIFPFCGLGLIVACSTSSRRKQIFKRPLFADDKRKQIAANHKLGLVWPTAGWISHHAVFYL
jgi:hypothetical protein